MVHAYSFPFSVQTCYIDMAMGSLDTTTVTLSPNKLIMSQVHDMPIFRIARWNLAKKVSKTDNNRLRMSIVMKRKITSEMMTTYFPSLLLTAITFATTFFKPFFFEAALSVNLTTMLVMTTIFISKMEGLPPTSDIKMIDIWLVLCQMVPFAEVVLLTAMEYHRKDKTEEKTKKRRKKKSKKNKPSQPLLINIVPEVEGKDEGLEKERSNLSFMSAENIEEEKEEGNRCQNCCTPDLKSLGMYASLEF